MPSSLMLQGIIGACLVKNALGHFGGMFFDDYVAKNMGLKWGRNSPISIMQQTRANYAASGKKGGSSILLKA